jgi:hypothetical protein
LLLDALLLNGGFNKLITSNMPQKNRGIIVLVIVIILLVVGVVMTNNKSGSAKLTLDEAKTKAGEFINNVLMQGEGSATIEEATVIESKLYALKVKLEGSEELIDSYITADGALFFPQSLDIAKLSGEDKDGEDKKENGKDEPVAEAPKADKPVVELFVMSHCPYGTQIEKGILPVVKALGNSIDFQLKFVNYAMHGKKELSEEMLQNCIDTKQHDKLIPYLECFLQDGNSTRCLGANGIDQAKINTCVADLDKQYRIIEIFDKKEGWDKFPPFPIHGDDNKKYNVGGSPTLAVNGKVIRSGRDSASLAKLICNSFAGEQPASCANEFSSDSPAPGFGKGTASGKSDATCN